MSVALAVAERTAPSYCRNHQPLDRQQQRAGPRYDQQPRASSPPLTDHAYHSHAKPQYYPSHIHQLHHHSHPNKRTRDYDDHHHHHHHHQRHHQQPHFSNDSHEQFPRSTGEPVTELYRQRKQAQLDELAKRRKLEAAERRAASIATTLTTIITADADIVHDTSLTKAPLTDSNRSQSFTGSDARRLAQRQKQLDLGKNSPEYSRYVALVPLHTRDPLLSHSLHPVTPRKNQTCSKRSWDGQVRKWRRLLHQYDKPLDDEKQPSSADTSVDAITLTHLHSQSQNHSSDDFELEAVSELFSNGDDNPISSISMSTSSEGEQLAVALAEDVLADDDSDHDNYDTDADGESEEWRMQQEILNLARSM